ncbi:MerR family transcriptional regulator [Niallia taxi]|uniref:DNA-binding protein n=1 Tax=Niallia taxi TaxID=2499688 RepID=UPI003982A151
MDNTESYGYFAKDVALNLDINTNTLRRWAIELEKHGYSFERTNQNHRIYYERDFKTLRELKKLIAKDVPLENALNAVVSMDLDSKKAVQTPTVHDEIRVSRSELEDVIHKTVKKAVEEEREAMLKAFEHKINDVVEQRDRVLTTQLQNTLEERRLEIAAAAEEKKWWKFWK